MKIKEITQEEFNQLPSSKKMLCIEEYPRRFALLQLNNDFDSLALCWQSNLVKPQIIDDARTPLFWFGIDQQLLALSKLNGKVILNLTLPSNLLELSLIKNSVVSRTELEIYSFSLNGFIQLTYNLPDITESLKIDSESVKVRLINGETLSLEI